MVVPADELAGGARDLGRQVEVEQEVLAEGAAGRQIVFRDDLAQRRQAIAGHGYIRMSITAARRRSLR